MWGGKCREPRNTATGTAERRPNTVKNGTLKIISHDRSRKRRCGGVSNRLNCVVFFLYKRSRTSVEMAIGRHILAPHHHPLRLPCQPHFPRTLSIPMAGLLIGLSGTTNDLSVPSGGPSCGRCSGTNPALPFRRGRVSENPLLCESGSGLTGHQRRRILSQVGGRRTPNGAKTRREGRGSVACTGHARALA